MSNGGDVLLGFLSGLTGETQRRREDKQQALQPLREILFRRQVEQAFPTEEEQAKQEARSLIGLLAPQFARQRVGATRAELEQPGFARAIAPIETQERLGLFERFGLLPKSQKDLFQQILEAEELSAARARGTTAVQQQKAEEQTRLKQRTELQQRLRELEVSERGITSLFQRANTKAPPISGIGAIPGILPVVATQRRLGLATGFSEQARGFVKTFPVEARKQLRTLEKGGRFTDKDIEQIIAAATPEFTESTTSRSAKLQELLDKIREERATINQQLLEVGGTSIQQPSSGVTSSGLRYTIER